MTEKFTEEEYQKIVEIADKYFDKHKELAVTVNLKSIYEYIFYNGIVEKEKIRKLNQEFALIALPKSRDWAHEQFVDKEKKYYWRHKKNDKDGDSVYLDIDAYGVMAPHSFYSHQIDYCPAFTEKEIIEAGYNPDYYWKEEVE